MDIQWCLKKQEFLFICLRFAWFPSIIIQLAQCHCTYSFLNIKVRQLKHVKLCLQMWLTNIHYILDIFAYTPEISNTWQISATPAMQLQNFAAAPVQLGYSWLLLVTIFVKKERYAIECICVTLNVLKSWI